MKLTLLVTLVVCAPFLCAPIAIGQESDEEGPDNEKRIAFIVDAISEAIANEFELQAQLTLDDYHRFSALDDEKLQRCRELLAESSARMAEGFEQTLNVQLVRIVQLVEGSTVSVNGVNKTMEGKKEDAPCMDITFSYRQSGLLMQVRYGGSTTSFYARAVGRPPSKPTPEYWMRQISGVGGIDLRGYKKDVRLRQEAELINATSTLIAYELHLTQEQEDAMRKLVEENLFRQATTTFKEKINMQLQQMKSLKPDFLTESQLKNWTFWVNGYNPIGD